MKINIIFIEIGSFWFIKVLKKLSKQIVNIYYRQNKTK